MDCVTSKNFGTTSGQLRERKNGFLVAFQSLAEVGVFGCAVKCAVTRSSPDLLLTYLDPALLGRFQVRDVGTALRSSHPDAPSSA